MFKVLKRINFANSQLQDFSIFFLDKMSEIIVSKKYFFVDWFRDLKSGISLQKILKKAFDLFGICDTDSVWVYVRWFQNLSSISMVLDSTWYRQ